MGPSDVINETWTAVNHIRPLVFSGSARQQANLFLDLVKGALSNV